MSNALNAKVTGGRSMWTTLVTLECPKLEQHENGVGFSPCEAEIEIEFPEYGGIPTFLEPECPCCHTVFAENDLVRETLIKAALDAIDNYDGPHDDPDAWSGGFARNH